MTAALSVLAFIKANWKLLAVGAAASALGWWLHPKCPVCAPAVHEVAQQHSDGKTDTQRDTKATTGKLHEEIEEDFACPPAPAPPPPITGSVTAAPLVPFAPQVQPPILLRRFIKIDEGPGTVETKAATEQETQQDTRLHLDVTPAPAVSLPRFSVFWEPQVKPWQMGQVGADVRIGDRVWLGAWVAPLESGIPAGATLRVTF